MTNGRCPLCDLEFGPVLDVDACSTEVRRLHPVIAQTCSDCLSDVRLGDQFAAERIFDDRLRDLVKRVLTTGGRFTIDGSGRLGSEVSNLTRDEVVSHLRQLRDLPSGADLKAVYGSVDLLVRALGYDARVAIPRMSPSRVDIGPDTPTVSPHPAVKIPAGEMVARWAAPVAYRVAPAFYEDPLSPGQQRWNDGTAWTHRVFRDGSEVAECVGSALADTGSNSVPGATPSSAFVRWVEAARGHAEGPTGDRAEGVDFFDHPNWHEVRELCKELDLVDNELVPAPAPAYVFALEYFGDFRMRSAELAVYERFEQRFGCALDLSKAGVEYAEGDLRARGYMADPVNAGFAFRGDPPAEADLLEFTPAPFEQLMIDDVLESVDP